MSAALLGLDEREELVAPLVPRKSQKGQNSRQRERRFPRAGFFFAVFAGRAGFAARAVFFGGAAADFAAVFARGGGACRLRWTSVKRTWSPTA